MKSFCQSIWFKRSLAVFLLLTLLLGILPKHAVRATELTEESVELPSVASVEADTRSTIGESLLLDAIDADAEGDLFTSAVIPTLTPLSEIMPLANAVEGMEMEFVDITFDANGGEFADGETVSVNPYPKDSEIWWAFAEREGYDLIGWTLNNELVTDWTTQVADISKTYRAEWKIKAETVDITFDANGGKFADDSSSETVTLEKGSTTYPLTPIRLGYKLTGWTINGETIGEWDQITADVSKTYTAIWVETVDISFDANGGKFADGETVSVNPYPKDSEIWEEFAEREGYDLIGWTLNNELVTDWTTQVADISKTYIAEWKVKPETVDITFDANGGKFADDSSSETVTLEKGSTTYPLTPIRLGYKLTGWTINGETIGEWDQITADVSKTYTAIF